MKKTTILLCLAALFLGSAAYAAGEGYSAAQYAEVAKTDTATKMLGYLFGDVKGYFEGTNTHIAKMFLVFNAAVASVAVLMLLINVMAATIQTAHEGEVLGKRYSTIWMPIRNVWGLAGVFPILGGWSIGQAIMFLAALVGIGIGTLTWKAAVSGMMESVAPPALLPVANVHEEAVLSLMRAQMCALGYNDERKRGGEQLQSTPVITQYSSPLTTPSSPDNPWLSFNGGYLVYGADPKASPLPHNLSVDFCGGVKVSLPEQSSVGSPDSPATQTNMARGGGVRLPMPRAAASLDYKAIASARFQALQQMDASLWPLSQAFYTTGQAPSKAALRQVADQYSKQVGDAVAAQGSRMANEFMGSLGVEGQSFIWAGAIFNRISSMQRQLVAASTQPLESVAPLWDSNMGVIDNLKSLASTALNKINIFKEKARPGFDAESPDVTSHIAKSVFSPTLYSAISWMTSGEADLMVGLSNLGGTIISVVVSALIATKILLFTGALASTKILGTGLDLNALLNFIGNLAILISAPLLFAGVIFAYYVPMIPMITWYGGVLSWFIVVAEAVVAAPLWMLAHMEAEGEGMGQKTAHGYMFLFNLFFRPALMVIGLVIGWAILKIFGFFLAYTLSIFFGSQNEYHSPVGLFMFMACLVTFASLAMYTVNKAFSLIHVVPDQVFAWVGGHFKGFGGDEARDSHHDFVGVARVGQHKTDDYVSGQKMHNRQRREEQRRLDDERNRDRE